MAWDDVRLFLALYRARTVGQAAMALGVDTSTVSRRLVALERALASTLFERGRDGARATQAAEDLLPAAELVEHSMQQFERAADGLERDVQGLVRITCPPDVSQVILLPVMQEVFQEHPGLQISLEPSESVRDLTRREADIALRIVRPSRGDLVFKKVFDVAWQVVGAPDLVKRLGVVDDWATVPWLGFGERLEQIPAARWRAERAGKVATRLRSDSFATQLQAASAGIGVGIFPALTAEHYGLAKLQVSDALQDDLQTLPKDELYLVTHRALRSVPRIQVVWDRLVAEFAARAP